MKQGAKRVLIVDDHPIIREGLTMLINRESDLEVCAAVPGLSQAMQAYRETKPDLLIVDLSLENGSGIELIKELVAQDPEIKVLVSSMHDEQLFAERALRAGARGYLNKAEATTQVVTAIRSILAGRVHLSAQMTNRMLCRTVGIAEGIGESPVATLSDRELDVFEHIGGATRPGRSPRSCTSARRPSKPIARTSRPSSTSRTPRS
jgi:DNA-binding NarL/FixJ family response regulator